LPTPRERHRYSSIRDRASTKRQGACRNQTLTEGRKFKQGTMSQSRCYVNQPPVGRRIQESLGRRFGRFKTLDGKDSSPLGHFGHFRGVDSTKHRSVASRRCAYHSQMDFKMNRDERWIRAGPVKLGEHDKAGRGSREFFGSHGACQESCV